MDIKNQIPSILYRAFSSIEYARDFIEQGVFRMGSPDYYKKIEDEKRRDLTEGTGHIKASGYVIGLTINDQGKIKKVNTKPGIMDHRAEQLNCKYLLCCSGPEVGIDYLRDKFGACIVTINDPVRLAGDITNWLHINEIPIIGKPDWVKVRYDKGLIVEEQFNGYQLSELSFSQKDPGFSMEHEYRLVVMMPSVSACNDHIRIEIKRRLNYVEYLQL